jgi:VanZ family protein
VARSRLVLVWLPVVVWAAVIFAFSSIPSLGTGLGTWDTVLRKCAHVTEYAIFGALLLRALGRELPAFLAGVAYAATDELHQHFVAGRHASPIDVGIDAVGVAIGVVARRRLAERGRRSRSFWTRSGTRGPCGATGWRTHRAGCGWATSRCRTIARSPRRSWTTA